MPSVFPSMQFQQKQQPTNSIELLSEYAITTTPSPFFFATTTLKAKTIFSEEYVRELENIGDDYNPDDPNSSVKFFLRF